MELQVDEDKKRTLKQTQQRHVQTRLVMEQSCVTLGTSTMLGTGMAFKVARPSGLQRARIDRRQLPLAHRREPLEPSDGRAILSPLSALSNLGTLSIRKGRQSGTQKVRVADGRIDRRESPDAALRFDCLSDGHEKDDLSPKDDGC